MASESMGRYRGWYSTNGSRLGPSYTARMALLRRAAVVRRGDRRL